jgi:trehalose-6-phosphate hydrolase
MTGTKPDKYIREPMLWDADESDDMRTTWIKPLFNTTHNVEPMKKQALNNLSILNHYRRLILTRNKSEALSIGTIKERETEKKQLLSFYREYKNEKLLIIHNLSESSQTFTLDGADCNYQTALFSSSPRSLVKAPLVILAPYASVILSK